MTNKPIEHALIDRLAGAFPRSPLQLNGLHEADAELIKLPGTDIVLALTTDAIVEEIELGLYVEPHLIGWMAIMASASDLAAVGADPIGVLLNETLPPDLDELYLSELQRGIRSACEACDLSVLGGDTNLASKLQLETTALGIVPDGVSLTRVGCEPGDVVFSSGPLGLGGAFALLRFGLAGEARLPSVDYQPRARLSEGRLLRRYASCCMDTSDGALSTLDELIRLNRVGFQLEAPVESLLHSDALQLAEAADIPPWMMFAGPHGEFELLFAVPAERSEEFRAAANLEAWQPIEIGRVVPEPVLRLDVHGRSTTLDTRLVRDLFLKVGCEPESYVAELLRLDRALAGGRETRRETAPHHSGAG